MPGRSYSHRYGTHPEQVADLHLPADGAGPHPVVVLLHGGFWRERYRRDLMAPLAEDLAARGVAAWNVEYRRLDCGGGWPVTAEDVAAAIDALADLDAPLALDAGVAVVGHSAGGHLALCAASGPRPQRVTVARAVGQAAVTDLEAASRLGLGAGVADRFGAGALAEASPRGRAPLGVPVLLVHGADDDTVPASLSEGFPGAEVSVRPGEGHYEHIDPRSGAWEEVVAWLTS